MSMLTDKQKDELHKSMLSYLHTSHLTSSYEALKAETGNEEFQPDEPGLRTHGLLEKKWTSVVRLQKKIMDLEARNASLTHELSTSTRTLTTSSASDPNWLPRAPQLHTLTGHRSPITRLAFHPVFTVIASASEDSTVKVWDWESGECERTLRGHTKGVIDLDYDGKGELLVTCSNDLSIKLWSTLDTYKCIKTLHGHDHTVSSVRFLPPNGEFIVSTSRDKTVRIWEVATGFCTKVLGGHEDWVRGVTCSEDGRMLGTSSNDQTCRIWDTSTGDARTVLRGHEHVVECAEFAPVNAYGAIREMCGVSLPANDPRLKQPGSYIATGSRDKSIRIWDCATGQCLKVLNGHDNWIRSLLFHPSGKYLLSSSDDKTVKCWDLSNGGRCARTIEAHEHFVCAMVWGRASVGGGETAPARVAGGVNAVNGKDGVGETRRRVNVMATGSVDQTIKIWTP